MNKRKAGRNGFLYTCFQSKWEDIIEFAAGRILFIFRVGEALASRPSNTNWAAEEPVRQIPGLPGGRGF
jgi:hypothetical protein